MRNIFKREEDILSLIPPKLKCEQVVELENGERYIVLSNKLLGRYGCIDRKEYNKKLKNIKKENHNIEKIYNNKNLNLNLCNLEIVWIRI